MKPNFALSLSFEGIRLLHRSPTGWSLVGEVPLDEPDLGGALAAMRATAVGLEPGGLRTKLMLPPDQVRVLEATGSGEAQARAALEGATPYAVADLAYDHATVGGRFRVAAVARETLEEAEAFATEHRFHPVSFAALLPGADHEAYFGETRLARTSGERVERDETPPVPQARRPAEPAPADQDARLAGAEPGAPPSAIDADTAAVENDPTTAEEPMAVVTPLLGPPPAVEWAAREVAASPAAPAERADTAIAPADAAAKPQDGVVSIVPDEGPLSAQGVPEPMFASRARAAGLRAEETVVVGATRVPLRAPARVPLPPPPRPAVPKDPRLGRSEPPVMRHAPSPQAGQSLQAPPPPSRRTPVGSERPAVAVMPAATAALAEPAAPARATDRRPTHLTPPRAVQEAEGTRGKPRFLGLILTVILLLAMLIAAVWASWTPQGLAGLFRRAADPIADATAPTELATTPDVAPEADAMATPVPATPDQDEAARAAAVVAAAIQALPMPQATIIIPRGTPVSAAEADRIYAATGVWLRAPNLADLPAADEVPAASAPQAVAERPPAVEPILQAAAALDAEPASLGLPPTPAAVPTPVEVALAAAPSLTAPDAVAPAADASPAAAVAPEALAPAAEADAALTLPATRPTKLPPTRPGPTAADLLVAAAPGGPAVSDAPREAGAAGAAVGAASVNAMAESPATRPALRPAEPALPPSMLAVVADGPPAADPAMAEGAVPGETQGPPTALAFAETAQTAPATPPGSVGLAAFDGSLPRARPEGLVPPSAIAPAPLVAFDGPRPGLRPESLAPPVTVAEAPPAEPVVDPEAVAAAVALAQVPEAAPAAPPEPDVQTALASIVAAAPDPLAGATRLAVAAASRPDARPRNFDRVVRDQLGRTARAQQPAAAAALASAAAPRGSSPEAVEAGDPEIASAAAAAPSGPTPQSVAQTATFADVMALREINLIGVFGQPSDRHALVRTGNGRYLKVSVGDSLDGGQVTAIGDNVLNYTKRGRALQLVIPGA